MIDIGYANTRIVGMRKRLMSRAMTEEILAFADVQTIADRLLQSDYQSELKTALQAHPSVQALDEALSAALAKTFDRLMALYKDRGNDAIVALVEEWDVRALKAVLRGVHKQAPADQIKRGIGPTAILRKHHLAKLANAADVATVVTMLDGWSFSWGRTLVALLPQYKRDRILDPLMLTLDNRRINNRFASFRVDVRMACDVLSMVAEVANIVACLTSLDSGKKAQLRPQGSRGTGLIKALARAKSFDECLIALARSEYRRALDQVLPLLVMEPGKYALLERRLDWQLLRHAKRNAVSEPLSIATPYYYMFCKHNEVMNLRLIVHGLDAGVPRDSIRAGLVFMGDS